MRRLPAGDGQQIYALDLLTGKKIGHNFVERKAKTLTKSTFLLLDSLQSIGDFGQHLKDYPECLSTSSFAVAVIVGAIRLSSTRNPAWNAGVHRRERGEAPPGWPSSNT